jgi:1,4-dihydroxy-2-naphthoate polyprenyltransferase
MSLNKTYEWIRQFLVAMRIFSLTLALGATTIGILAAWRDGSMENPGSIHTILLMVLITLAGLASQAGANLINDFFEGSFKYADPSMKTLQFLGQNRSVFDVFIFLSGIGILGFAALIGIYLIYLTDWVMFLIGFVGLMGSYAYTGKPFVYKTKGLGVVLSFLLMGPLMQLGAYYPFSAHLSWYPVLLGLPISLLIPALMLSNEIRDFKRDSQLRMGTMSTMIGSRMSLKLYDILVFGSILLSEGYVLLGLYPLPVLAAILLLPVALKARKYVARYEGPGILWTSRVHLGSLIILTASLFLW